MPILIGSTRWTNTTIRISPHIITEIDPVHRVVFPGSRINSHIPNLGQFHQNSLVLSYVTMLQVDEATGMKRGCQSAEERSKILDIDFVNPIISK